MKDRSLCRGSRKKRYKMINLTRLNGQNLAINGDLIERIEDRPDTIITLITGNQFIVKDSVEQVMEKVIQYKQRVNTPQTNSLAR
jgi:flagellar protein FlbD